MPLARKIPAASGKPKSRRQFWTLPGQAIALLVLVALIESYPHLSASPEGFASAGDRIPSFTISNDAYLRVTDVEATCYIRSAKITGPAMTNIAPSEFSVPPQKFLAASESFTVPCFNGLFLVAPTSSLSSVDLAVVVYCRPWLVPFLRVRRFFAFEARNEGNGVDWYPQATNHIDKDFDAFRKTKSAPAP
jgi:hypothetical protein